jgi:hypothetical protein
VCGLEAALERVVGVCGDKKRETKVEICGHSYIAFMCTPHPYKSTSHLAVESLSVC